MSSETQDYSVSFDDVFFCGFHLVTNLLLRQVLLIAYCFVLLMFHFTDSSGVFFSFICRFQLFPMFNHFFTGVSLVVQAVKSLPPMQENWVHSLGQEDPLEEGMAGHSSILAWRIPWTEEPGGPTVHRVAKSWTRLSSYHFTSTISS